MDEQILNKFPNSQHFYAHQRFKFQAIKKWDERMDHDKDNDNEKEYTQKIKEDDLTWECCLTEEEEKLLLLSSGSVNRLLLNLNKQCKKNIFYWLSHLMRAIQKVIWF